MHASIVLGLTQKVPFGQELGDVDPLAQNVPFGHGAVVFGVAQKFPLGHRVDVFDPTGQ